MANTDNAKLSGAECRLTYNSSTGRPINIRNKNKDKIGTISGMCAAGNHKKCFKLDCPCKCGHQ